MRLFNETLSDLKAYARREYSLRSNVPVLVMLITEEEYKGLKEKYNKKVEADVQSRDTLKDSTTEDNATYGSEEFFSNVASIFELVHNYTSEALPIVTPILRKVFDIPHFGRYRYAIIVREEKLLEWGNQMDIQVDDKQATGKNRKLIIFCRVLAQEFLHIVENEKGIQIFGSKDCTDSEIVQRALKAVKVFRDIDIFSN